MKRHPALESLSRDHHHALVALQPHVLQQRGVAREDVGARDVGARELAEVGVDVERHVQREIRGIVSPVPDVEVVRQSYAPESWRSAAV